MGRAGPSELRKRVHRTGVVVAAFLALGPAAGDAAAAARPGLLGADAATLIREPMITPEGLGTDRIDGLQFANPSEQIDLVSPPQVDNSGDADLSLPMTIPRGRGGVQPDLTLRYSSSNDNGWLGLGWGLDVGSVEVDTRWGVAALLGRQGDRDVHARRRRPRPDGRPRRSPRPRRERAVCAPRRHPARSSIIRHGNSPKNYWWEVRDKNGAIRWYGGHPDGGGPFGYPAVDANGHDVVGLDSSAVLRDASGNIYRWALSAQRDVGVNMMRYPLRARRRRARGRRRGPDGRPAVPQGDLLHGGIAGRRPRRGPGRTRSSSCATRTCPAAGPRKDVIIDGTAGLPRGDRPTCCVASRCGPARRSRTSAWDPTDPATSRTSSACATSTRSRERYNLKYREGAFGKSLLERVEQVGSDNAVFAHNDLAYFDEVSSGGGDYDGFEPEENWDADPSNSDQLGQDLLGPIGVSALGAAETNQGDGHTLHRDRRRRPARSCRSVPRCPRTAVPPRA